MKLFYEKKTNNVFKSSKQFWSFYKSVVKTKKSKNSQLVSKLVDPVNGSSTSDPIAIANLFNKHFTNIKEASDHSDDESLNFIDSTFNDLKRDDKIKTNNFSFKYVSIEEVESSLAKVDAASSCGISMIPAIIFKNSASTLAPHIASLFNHSIKVGIFPSEFKITICFPLFKKGDHTICDNYRGINILPLLAKIFEGFLSRDITAYFEENKLLSGIQHGFRANFSCETALQSVLDDWKAELSKRNSVLSLFIDFKKAFDLLSPKLLFRKLFHYGFDNNSLKLMSNYFKDRYQKTKLDKNMSDLDMISNGVPQGSILGPLLFIIFINDMCYISQNKTILFADDTTLYSANKTLDLTISSFKKDFENVYNWISLNKLFINWTKTKFMLVSRTKHPISTHIELFGNKVEMVNEFKLLGVTIDKDLNFSKFVKALSKSIYAKVFSIKNIFFLSYKTKVQFFKTFILPHFDYCSSLFLYFSNGIINKISNIYNNCIRILFNINLKQIDVTDQLDILKDLNLLPFKLRLLYRFSIFAYKILNKITLTDLILINTSHSHSTRNTNIYVVLNEKSLLCSRRLSIFLPKFVNIVLRHSFNLKYYDFKNSFILLYYNSFLKIT